MLHKGEGSQRLGSRSLAYLEVAVAASIWGSNGVIVNRVPLDPYAIAFFRVFFGGSALALGLLLAGRWELLRVGRRWRSLVALGGLLGLGWVTLFQAMRLIPIADAVLLNYTAPIFVALLTPLLLKERVERWTWAALALSMAGVSLISLPHGFSPGGFSLLGVSIGVSAGLVYASFIILSKRLLASVPSISLALYAYLSASAFLSPSLAIADLSLGPASWALLLTLGVSNTAFAVTLYFRGLSSIKAQEAAVLTYLEPVSAMVFGYAFLNQEPTHLMIAGGALILSAGYVLAHKGTR